MKHEIQVIVLLLDVHAEHFCCCPKPGPGFLTSYVVMFFVFSELRLEVIVHFVDIVGILDHHCLNFLFIIHIYPITKFYDGTLDTSKNNFSGRGVP